MTAAGLSDSIRTLHPAYFAMVMATGVVAVSAHLLGMFLLATLLTWLNLFTFVTLVVLLAARLIWYPAPVWSDLMDHNRGVGFFTLVAGTCVVGIQLIVVLHQDAVARILWFAAILLWAGLIYTIFAGFTVKPSKPSLAEGINGGWLIAIVATQAVCILGVQLLPLLEPYRAETLFFCLSLWLCGGMLYIWMISLIFYRYTFFTFSPSDLMPPYWVNMGAMAISTLAGTTLIAHASEAPLLGDLLPFLRGFTVLFWATATWWIPMLIILSVWRHVYKKFPLAYDPLYWGGVFPLGVYTVCTYELARVLNVPFLFLIPRYFVHLALVAWALTFGGLVSRLLDVALAGSAERSVG